MPPRLFFVRHGEAEHNPFIVKGKAEPDPEVAAPLLKQGRSILNPRLTEKGREQAALLRKSLDESGQTFDLLITSPLARAVETSHLAFGAAAKRFMITPELVETAEAHLGGVRCPVSIAQPRWDTAQPYLHAACPQPTRRSQDRGLPSQPQRGDSAAVMLKNHLYLAQWDLAELREGAAAAGANWVLGEPLELCPAAYHHPLPVEERLGPLRDFLLLRPEATVVVVGHSMVFDRLLGKQMKNCELVEHAF